MSRCADNFFFNSISTVGHQLFGLSLISYTRHISGLYYKPMMIVSDDSRVVNKLEASLTDARVIIYDCHMFIVQATGLP